MPYLKEIVTEINRQFQVNIVNDKLIPQYTGICTVVPVLDEELSRFPTFMNEDGNAEFNAIDDRKNFCVYHKVNSKNINTYESNFGDGNDTKRMVVDMSLICFAKKSQLRLTSDEIEDLILATLPTELNYIWVSQYTGLSFVSIAATTIISDAYEVWNSEFDNYKFMIRNDQALFKLNYQIELIYRQSCLQTCQTC